MGPYYKTTNRLVGNWISSTEYFKWWRDWGPHDVWNFTIYDLLYEMTTLDCRRVGWDLSGILEGGVLTYLIPTGSRGSGTHRVDLKLKH